MSIFCITAKLGVRFGGKGVIDFWYAFTNGERNTEGRIQLVKGRFHCLHAVIDNMKPNEAYMSCSKR